VQYISSTLILVALSTGLLSVGTRQATIAGLTTFPLAILFLCYALYKYTSRARKIQRRDPDGYYDPVGP
jgi:hypothetical protein